MRSLKLFSALILFCVLTIFVSADHYTIPSDKIISFQGYLTDKNGKAYTGTVFMKFKFYYNSDTNSSQESFFTSSSQEVTAFDGNYTTKIDLEKDYNTIINNMTSTNDLWIEVWVDDHRMTPRIEMTAAPYAMLVKGIKYDAVNDVVMIGYPSSKDISVIGNSDSKMVGGMVVENYISIGDDVGTGTTPQGNLYIHGSNTAYFDGDANVNKVEAGKVFGAIWN
ncbi:MAG: hypothetical protein LBK68_05100 [Candidatus Margulisbacteria bacterium]|jgi:hypothetical protein|nr:hypothetical protein [Candidatus Margulisiibacteriota bacterium]